MHQTGKISGVVVVLVGALGACAPLTEEETRAGALGGVPTGRNIDILFMVDNSASMLSTQMKLTTTFPGIMDVLTTLPRGLPDVHIGVVSSDMGAGNGSITSCNGNGNAGVLQYIAHPPCATTGLAAGATYISNVSGVANYTGDLRDVFTCIANLGEEGCGFEQQLGSISRALGADDFGAPPAENQGFLRENAYLAIIMITNEDDCSAREGAASPLYGADERTLDTALGPVGSFRCNEFGHLCDGAAPPRLAPNGQLGETVALANCVSNESSPYLTPVATFAQQIKALKPNPNREILVFALAAPTAPYVVSWQAPTVPDTGPWPTMTPSCGGSDDDTYPHPPVRIAQLVGTFGQNGIMLPLCADDYGPSLRRIEDEIGRLIGDFPADGGVDGASGGSGGGGGGSGGSTGAGGSGGVGLGGAGGGAPGGMGGSLVGTGGQTGGAAGSPAGRGGQAGATSGTGGSTGAAGATGAGGATGVAGTTGSAGSGAVDAGMGRGGQTGSGGTSGAAGTTGAGGRAGAAGSTGGALDGGIDGASPGGQSGGPAGSDGSGAGAGGDPGAAGAAGGTGMAGRSGGPGGSSARDAGADSNGGSDGDGGCGCRLVPAAGRDWTVAFLLGLAVLAGRRRRG